ncbi:MAG: hypothetical protein PHE27_02735 [Alphaproteobacteria bacterium]|nr:hypothetical protein [Alphaproteobacteria bacterium]
MSLSKKSSLSMIEQIIDAAAPLVQRMRDWAAQSETDIVVKAAAHKHCYSVQLLTKKASEKNPKFAFKYGYAIDFNKNGKVVVSELVDQRGFYSAEVMSRVTPVSCASIYPRPLYEDTFRKHSLLGHGFGAVSPEKIGEKSEKISRDLIARFQKSAAAPSL